MKFDERNNFFFLNPPFFYFHDNCGKVCPTDTNLFGLSHSTRCGCDKKHYCKMWEVWSEFNIFWTLVTMPTATILNFFNPRKLSHTTVDIPIKFHEVWWKESKNVLNPPFFVSVATAAMFVQLLKKSTLNSTTSYGILHSYKVS